ncbi:MAG: hypothetical protein WA209_15340 [Candidatus Acidiferrales bacterium]
MAVAMIMTVVMAVIMRMVVRVFRAGVGVGGHLVDSNRSGARVTMRNGTRSCGAMAR